MEEQREPLCLSDLINAGRQRHTEAWDRLRQIYLDYSLDPPTLAEVFASSTPTEFEQARDAQGQSWGDVTLWLMGDVMPRLGLPRTFYPIIEHVAMMPHGGIINLEGGYFIRRPAIQEGARS